MKCAASTRRDKRKRLCTTNENRNFQTEWQFARQAQAVSPPSQPALNRKPWRKGEALGNSGRCFDSYPRKEENTMSLQPIKKDEVEPANKVMREVLSTVAAGYDSIRPGAGDCVREMAEEKYPTHAEHLQHLANLCDRHKRYLLPRPTASTCVDCEAELKAR